MKRPAFFGAMQAKGRAQVATGSRLVNWFARQSPMGAVSEVGLYGTAGTRLFADTGSTNPILGMHKFGDLVYAATRENLYSINEAGATINIGPILLSGAASFADNGQQMVLCDGARGYKYDGTTLSEISDAAFYPSSSVAFMDGYLIFVRDGTQQYFITGLDAVTFDALDFASAETQNDKLLAVLQDHRELWLFGETSIEVHYNRGDADFPFKPISGALVEHGIASPFAMAKADNSVFILSNEGIVYRFVGYQAQRVSTHEIEHAIGQRDISTARAFAWYEEGHTFIQWNIGSDLSVVFDVSTGFWHERSHIDHGRHHANSHVLAFGKNLVGDFSTGKIYEQDLSIYDDAGRPMIALGESAPLHLNRDRAFHSTFEARHEPGVGLTTGQGSDPKIMMQFSDDGGVTWSNERWKSLGARGERGTRTVWRRLGNSRERIYRVAISDPVQRAMLATAYVEVAA